jgi:hypothetical protein
MVNITKDAKGELLFCFFEEKHHQSRTEGGRLVMLAKIIALIDFIVAVEKKSGEPPKWRT